VFEQTAWYISEKLWVKLTPAQQAAFQKGAAEGGKVADAEIQKLDDSVPAVLKAAGATYTVPDRAAFRKAWAPLASQFEGKVWPAGLTAELSRVQH
jgi:TRAP-type C4-dicarboxylate transport system substrate-binding protein